MAYVTNTRVARKGWLDRLPLMIEMARTAVRQRRVFLRTVAELEALSDRELADLGIARIAIREIAHEAAYGK